MRLAQHIMWTIKFRVCGDRISGKMVAFLLQFKFPWVLLDKPTTTNGYTEIGIGFWKTDCLSKQSPECLDRVEFEIRDFQRIELSFAWLSCQLNQMLACDKGYIHICNQQYMVSDRNAKINHPLRSLGTPQIDRVFFGWREIQSMAKAPSCQFM